MGVTSHQIVYHVGDLSGKREKPSFSHEGKSLSVSKTPREWMNVTHLSGPVTVLWNQNGRFYEAKTEGGVRKEEQRWCETAGYVSLIEGRKLSYSSNGERTYQLFETASEAEAAAQREEYDDVSIEEGLIPKLDSKGVKSWRSAFSSSPDSADPIDVQSLIPLWYAEHGTSTSFDGVWWHYEYRPATYSLPKGCIFQSQLSSWDAVWKGEEPRIPPESEIKHVQQSGESFEDLGY